MKILITRKGKKKICYDIRLVSALFFYLVALFISFNTKATANDKLDTIDVNDIIAKLATSVSIREAQSRRNELLGTKVSQLNLIKWINEEPDLIWPTQKLTLLWFWCIDCSASRLQIKEMGQWAARVEDMGGQFISIHAYKDEDGISGVEKLLKENNYQSGVAIDQRHDYNLYWGSKTFHAFGINIIPQCVIVSADGRILSYKEPSTDYWDKLVEKDSTELEPDAREDIWSLTIAPSSWNIESFQPCYRVSQRFLLFRPDTPDLYIKILKSSDPNIVITYKKFSDKNQTICELLCQTTIPRWSKILKGVISIEVEYNNFSDTFEIPFKIASKPLLSKIPSIYLGMVKNDKEIVKNVVLQPNVPRENLKLQIINIPNEITVELPESLGCDYGEIPIKLHFQSYEIGVRKGSVELKAIYNQGLSEQLIKIKYTAIVHE